LPPNDFEAVVAARYPELRAVIDALSAAGAAVAAMSGSGSSVFGLFPDLRTRDRAARTLARAGYRVARARTLSRAEYRKSSTPTRSAPNSSTGLSQSDAVV
jgi:4-diphosphocytidyl-2C-methyl-D-erythritol kinase